MSIIIPANSAVSGGFSVANSLMFNSVDSPRLTRSGATPTSAQKATMSFWIKRSSSGSAQVIVDWFEDSINFTRLAFESDDVLKFSSKDGNNVYGQLTTNRKFRDTSAWYNIIVAIDTTQGTASNRMKMYINGVQETSFSTETQPAQNRNFKFDAGKTVGANGGVGEFFNGYMSEGVYADGTQNAQTDFGEFEEDSGIWQPIDVSGLTFGNNGFYLDFEDSSALGNDAAGSNNFSLNNIAAIDQATDTCTNNFATVSASTPATGNLTYLRSGNLELKQNNNPYAWPTTLVATTGKWYWEQKVSALGTTAVGVLKQDKFPQNGSLFYPFVQATGFAYKNTGNKGNNNNDSSYGASYTNDDILSVAFDQTNGTIWFAKNGAWQNSATKTEIENGTTTNSAFSSMSTNGEFYGPFIYTDGSTVVFSNFGNPFFAISSGNSDGNDFGNFEYEVPTGYFSLCSKNLAEFG